VFQVPRGTRDFTTEDMQKRRHIKDKMTETFQLYGYQEIQTPSFETQELFTAKSGESIIEELYTFKDKSGRELALRPELTAPVIRFYVEKLQMKPKPLKVYYFGNCYRYDRPQKGRYREFYQAGCELIGANTPEAYAELIALAHTILSDAGLQHIQLNIGNLTVINTMFTILGLIKKQQKTLLPLIDKSEFTEINTYLQDIGLSDDRISTFLNLLQKSDVSQIQSYVKDDEHAEKELSLLQQVLDHLETSFNITNCQVKMSIVRGLDYYKGIVFEIEAPALGAEKQLCGGGAYDLVTLFGGTDVPTAGFAIGFDRTILALEAENYSFPSYETDVFLIPITEEMLPTTLHLAHQLRKNGKTTDIDLLRRGVGKALKYANAKHVRKVIIIGPKELKQNAVTLRDMESGKQKLINIKKIVSTLSKNTT
jgi:histidyl-tRNA synthetase